MEKEIISIWQKSKTMIKGLVILVLVLLLLVPAHFVQNLIQEREQRQKEAVAEVSGKWASRQNIAGPVLVIPYQEKTTASDGRPILVRHHAYFLPDKLEINGTVAPEKRHRGIYEVMLYSSSLNMKGRFGPLAFTKLQLDTSSLLWEEAFLAMKISDARGLRNEMKFEWNDSKLVLNPSPEANEVIKNSFVSALQLNAQNVTQEMTFNASIELNGSEQLFFTPVGKETTVGLTSSWPDPSFTGNRLPEQSKISKSGFTAQWKSLGHTHGFPQEWKDFAFRLGESSGNTEYVGTSNIISNEAFGVDLFVPVSGYQKTMRSIKYAILCILLTFTAFFLIETSNGKSVHPIQYALIGFALILFYTLLLSISEYTSFNLAYLVSALSTVALITWFVKGLLGSLRLSLLLSVVLLLLYSYVFTILQLQDYALLLGSIGLFLTLAVVMYFSRKVQW